MNIPDTTNVITTPEFDRLKKKKKRTKKAGKKLTTKTQVTNAIDLAISNLILKKKKNENQLLNTSQRLVQVIGCQNALSFLQPRITVLLKQ